MNGKSLVILTLAVFLVGAGVTITFLTSEPTPDKTTTATNAQVRVVDVDDVVNEPERYTGIIGIEGSVSRIGESGVSFALGCEDACVLMPVQYAGQIPEEGTNLIAYGEITKTEQAKYIFVASRLAVQ